MKKILVLTGSRRKKGNTITFIKNILKALPNENFVIEYIFPQDLRISLCEGCGNCFETTKCIINDDLYELQQKILASNLFVIASPVYLHYISADLKIILDRCSWWTHTLRLQGKPVVVLSTCDSNGHKKVINALGEIMTYMGGNVIASVNASRYPNKLNNTDWMRAVARKISERIVKYIELPPQSNEFLEIYFKGLRQNIIVKDSFLQQHNLENEEINFWKTTGMIKYDNFQDYLLSKSEGGDKIDKE